MITTHDSKTRSAARGAFTLIELLVTVAIMATLLAILLPAAGHTIASARSFRCQMSLRATAFDFAVFADETLHGDRGDDVDDPALGQSRFRLETFQEAQYGVDEFWRWGEALVHRVPDSQDNDPLRCPEVDGFIELRRNMPCSAGAVGPAQAVSFGFNLRLHQAQSDADGSPRPVNVALSSRIIDQGNVPLAWDVDGQAASRNRVSAVFSAPSLGDIIYGDDRYWFPGARHNGVLNVSFMDGRVVATGDPLAEQDWDWDYAPIR